MATYQELQGKNVRASLMLITVIAAIMVAAAYFIALAFFGGTPEAIMGALAIAGAVAGIQALFAWFGGADFVLRVSGAHEVSPDDPRFRKLCNVVEEMKIAAGLPMPRVYVMEDPSPNAFATGRNPEDGRVCVTTGLLEMLDRDELQGVIAHELAHIKNRDILFATIVGIMVGMIAIISDFMLRTFLWGGMGHSRGRSRGGGNAQAVLMLVGIVFAILAPIAAQLMRFAISRHREYLADASGAQFSRNPHGLAGALAKISGYSGKIQRANHGTAHMFISDPFKHEAHGGGMNLFSTHPPVERRIERLMQIGSSMNRPPV